ncbi:MAG: glycosyltransferase [Verrucomicrobiales bacterium]|nr:glycosyltransferase [Verrucomicrobiales bacterium]
MSATAPKAAIIISTYNWPAALRLVLKSLLGQSEGDVEVIVADDGSKPETSAVVSATLGPGRMAWCHVRQEDTGFRQSRVRNLGARVSSAPLLIFIDHDTVAHADFVADHLRLAEDGVFVQGKRCFLPPGETERLLKSDWEGGWWPSPWMRGLGNRKNAVHLPRLGRWLASAKSWETSIRGCNLAVRRDDFMAVDGFDELYDGVWGREDSDLAYRLFHRGVRCRNAAFAALQAHLHHPQVKRTGRDRLDDELDRTVAERRVKAIQGLSQMGAEGRIVASSPGFSGKLG